MNLQTLYFVLFASGLALCVLSLVSGFGHLRIGHLHRGVHAGHGTGGRHLGRAFSGINGFTILAFITWFGGSGYLLERYSSWVATLILLVSILFGMTGAYLVWAVLFKLLLPHERVLTTEETAMTGVLGHVSGAIRTDGGIGEIIFSQLGARRANAARSDDGSAIERGTEVVVVRYEHGVAYVRRLEEIS